MHPGSRPETDLREVEQPPDQLMKRIGDMFARRNRGHHTDHDEQHGTSCGRQEDEFNCRIDRRPVRTLGLGLREMSWRTGAPAATRSISWPP